MDTSNYLRDLGLLLREQAVSAKNEYDAAQGSEDEAYLGGRRMAYYEVVDLMLAQAGAFGLPPEALSLSGFDPAIELLQPSE